MVRTFEDGNSFGKNVKAEISEFRGRLDAIEAQLKVLNSNGVGTSSGPVTKEEGDEGPFGKSGVSVDGVEPEKATENVKSYSESVMEATYLMHEAATATRGYMMALTEAGLSKDQVKMLHQLQEGMMMMLKLGSTIRLLMKAQEAFNAAELAGASISPLGMFEVAAAGGMLAASVGYGSKLRGGEV